MKSKTQSIIRYSILSIILLAFAFLALRHIVLGGGVSPSVDALCPFGGVESAYTYATTGNLVPRIMLSSMILALGVFLTVLIFRRGFCGWICPFGTLQELFGKLVKKKYELPLWLDTPLRYLKYLVLLAILFLTAITGTLVFRNYDPFITFFHFGEGVFWGAAETTGIYIVFGILVFIVIVTLFIERFWCRYLCPLGAAMAPVSKIGLTKIVRDKKTCIDCKLCNKKCPMRVIVSTVDSVKDSECINCNECIRVCPKSSLSVRAKGRELNAMTYVIVLLLLFFSVFAASKIIGVWQSIPSTNLTTTDGTIDVENVRGWMSLQNVSDATKIPVQRFIIDWNLPQNIDSGIPLKEIAKTYAIPFDVEAFKEYLRTFDYASLAQSQSAPIFHVACPWRIIDDPTPGRCGLYVDTDGDGICDLSQ